MGEVKSNDLENVNDYRRDVSYSMYRDLSVRYENTVKRFIIAIILIVVVFLAAYTYREKRWIDFIEGYDISSESYVIDSGEEGNANYLESGNDGVINNGESDGEKKNNDQKE